MLVLEMRTLSVLSTTTCERTPAHLPSGCTALRATLRSCSGAQATVVLGGPPNGVLPTHPSAVSAAADNFVSCFQHSPPFFREDVT